MWLWQRTHPTNNPTNFQHFRNNHWLTLLSRLKPQHPFAHKMPTFWMVDAFAFLDSEIQQANVFLSLIKQHSWWLSTWFKTKSNVKISNRVQANSRVLIMQLGVEVEELVITRIILHKTTTVYMRTIKANPRIIKHTPAEIHHSQAAEDTVTTSMIQTTRTAQIKSLHPKMPNFNAPKAISHSIINV